MLLRDDDVYKCSECGKYYTDMLNGKYLSASTNKWYCLQCVAQINDAQIQSLIQHNEYTQRRNVHDSRHDVKKVKKANTPPMTPPSSDDENSHQTQHNYHRNQRAYISMNHQRAIHGQRFSHSPNKRAKQHAQYYHHNRNHMARHGQFHANSPSKHHRRSCNTVVYAVPPRLSPQKERSTEHGEATTAAAAPSEQVPLSADSPELVIQDIINTELCDEDMTFDGPQTPSSPSLSEKMAAKALANNTNEASNGGADDGEEEVEVAENLGEDEVSRTILDVQTPRKTASGSVHYETTNDLTGTTIITANNDDFTESSTNSSSNSSTPPQPMTVQIGSNHKNRRTGVTQHVHHEHVHHNNHYYHQHHGGKYRGGGHHRDREQSHKQYKEKFFNNIPVDHVQHRQYPQQHACAPQPQPAYYHTQHQQQCMSHAHPPPPPHQQQQQQGGMVYAHHMFQPNWNSYYVQGSHRHHNHANQAVAFMNNYMHSHAAAQHRNHANVVSFPSDASYPAHLNHRV